MMSRKAKLFSCEYGEQKQCSGVTVIWVSPSFGHPRAQIPSDMGIPFQYGCRVFGIPRYPPPMPKTLVIWVSPKHEIRKIFEIWILKN